MKEKRKEKRQLREIILKGEKKCRICELTKDISEFHIKKGTPDGHRSECKECVKGVQKKYKNPEKTKKYDKKRYEEKRKDILENKKDYYEK